MFTQLNVLHEPFKAGVPVYAQKVLGREQVGKNILMQHEMLLGLVALIGT